MIICCSWASQSYQNWDPEFEVSPENGLKSAYIPSFHKIDTFGIAKNIVKSENLAKSKVHYTEKSYFSWFFSSKEVVKLKRVWVFQMWNKMFYLDEF